MVDRIFKSKAVRSFVLASWVIVSMAVLLNASIGFIIGGSTGDVAFGIIAAVFSLTPLLVYYDIKISS